MSPKPVSKDWPPARLTKEDIICTKPGWNHADDTQDDKYSVLVREKKIYPTASGYGRKGSFCSLHGLVLVSVRLWAGWELLPDRLW